MTSTFPYEPPIAPRPARARLGRRGPGRGPGTGQKGRRRKRWYFVLLTLVLVAAAVVAVARVTCGVVDNQDSPGAFGGGASRNAVWAGPLYTPYKPDTIAANSAFPGWVVMPKFVDNYDIAQQLSDANKMIDDAPSRESAPKVMAYFSTSYWFDANKAWGSYADGFQDAFYLKDASGEKIPFWGAGNSADDSDEPMGYVVDLANPDYRAWVIGTIQKWRQVTPLSGIAFDAASPLIGTLHQRAPLADGESTWNQILCGSDAASSTSSGNCKRVDQWNAGMASLFSEARTALNPLGMKVIYNGVAPSDFRGPDRNVGLLQQADGTVNESFCLFATAHIKDKLEFRPIEDDIDMMTSVAAQKKTIFEITNYQSDTKAQYANYCQGAFLLGWQPGSSYWIYHQNYSDTTAFPTFAEQALDLGNPTAAYTKSGTVLMRQFQRGWVFVNEGDDSADVTIPAALTSFKNGKQAAEYTKGQKVSVGGHDALLLLDQSSFSSSLSGVRKVCQSP